MSPRAKLYVALAAFAAVALVAALRHARPRPAAPQAAAAAQAQVVRTAAVSRGRIAQSVTLSGLLQPVSHVELAAQLPSHVVAVSVREGQTVSAGTVLARLDDHELRTQLAKARAGVTAAAAQVSKARLGRDVSLDLSAARVDKARGGQLAADAAVTQADKGADLARRSSQAGVDQAMTAVEAAEANLAQAERGAALARQQAEADVDSAGGGVAAAEADVHRAETGADVAATSASADVERAKAALAAAEANVARVKAGAKASDIRAAEAAVAQARAGRDQAKKTLDDLEYLLKHGGVAGAEVDGARTQLAVTQAQLDGAEAQLAGARGGATAEEIAAAEAQVREARAGVAQAEAGRGRDKVSAADIEAARANLNRATSGLHAAEKARGERLKLADEQVHAAQAGVDQARAAQHAAEVGAGGGDVRRAEVEAARGNAAMAAAGVREAGVGRREAAVLAQDIAAAQAGLSAAEADYRLAAEQLTKTVITAPVSGTVTKLGVHAGDTVLPGMSVATLETQAAAELVALASPEQRERLHAGQSARLRVEGVARECIGMVRDVAASAESDGRTFKVRVVVSGSDLPPGAQATADIDTAVEPDALLVPAAALLDGEGDQATVFVVRDGRAARRAVTVGLREKEHAQVLEGLLEGETVVVEGAETLHDGAAVEAR